MALSEAALGKIRLAGQTGSTIPPTWATDAAGEPTTDPVAALQGLLLPMAGPKGYGLAIVVDALTGVLSGGAFGASVRGLYADTAAPNDCAHFFLALDPAPFAAGTGETFQQRLAALAGEVLAAPTASGTDRVYLPGQIEAERVQAARRDGVRVDREVVAALRRVAGGLGIPADELDRVAGAADAV
jgi:LDH2 family malate/lactate/ureidoglycolate dehydrogenase